uniref:Uncharacterized protein n=1 Tax=Spumella elongata TaxID=89044 RepID=A0A7S3H0Y1_9STRA
MPNTHSSTQFISKNIPIINLLPLENSTEDEEVESAVLPRKPSMRKYQPKSPPTKAVVINTTLRLNCSADKKAPSNLPPSRGYAGIRLNRKRAICKSIAALHRASQKSHPQCTAGQKSSTSPRLLAYIAAYQSPNRRI